MPGAALEMEGGRGTALLAGAYTCEIRGDDDFYLIR